MPEKFAGAQDFREHLLGLIQGHIARFREGTLPLNDFSSHLKNLVLEIFDRKIPKEIQILLVNIEASSSAVIINNGIFPLSNRREDMDNYLKSLEKELDISPLEIRFNSLENAVLGKLFKGNHPVLKVLSEQFRFSKVARRDFTGVGFFTRFEVLPKATVLKTKRSAWGGVWAEIKGLEHGAGFVLFITDGRLNFLEGYSYDEPWPNTTEDFTLRYDERERDFSQLEG